MLGAFIWNAEMQLISVVLSSEKELSVRYLKLSIHKSLVTWKSSFSATQSPVFTSFIIV